MPDKRSKKKFATKLNYLKYSKYQNKVILQMITVTKKLEGCTYD
jgi:hypothetical protein